MWPKGYGSIFPFIVHRIEWSEHDACTEYNKQRSKARTTISGGLGASAGAKRKAVLISSREQRQEGG